MPIEKRKSSVQADFHAQSPVSSPVSPKMWYSQIGRPTIFESLDRAGQMTISRFRDVDPLIEQPVLPDHVLAMHLGGAKRVTRSQGRSSDVFDVTEGTLTLMPASEAYRWRTEGPVDFAHITLSRAYLARLAIEEFDREPSELCLQPVVGTTDTLIALLFSALLEDAGRPGAGHLYREGLLVALSYNLTCRFSNAPAKKETDLFVPCRSPSSGGLAGWQLRRVIDYMRAHLAEDIQMSDLVALTGLSRAHFFKAFGCSVGRSPYAYLTDLRIRRARELLSDTRLLIGDIAAAVGLDLPRFSASFRKRVGLAPSAYRREFVRRVSDAEEPLERQ